MTVELHDLRLLIRACRSGAAAFDPTTGELRFDGLRYSTGLNDWSRLVRAIGTETLRTAVETAEAGRWATK